MPARKVDSRGATVRAVVAVGIVGGAYVLVVFGALALVVAPLVGWFVLDRIEPVLLAATVVGLGLLWMLVPQRERLDPPGTRMDREDQPELWRLIDTISTVIHQKVPAEIYLLDEMNAYVADVGGLFGFGGRRIMGLGVPLMRVLDPEEFGAVIAHELGHVRRGSVRLGPLVHRTRSSIGRSLADRSSRSRLLYRVWAERYLRFTQPVAAAQERSADDLAATATSPRAIAGALARLPFGTVAFDVYMRTEYLPVLEAGFQPPFLEGFDTFLTSEVAQEHLRLEAHAAFGASSAAPYDGHPPVPVRLAALGIDAAEYRDRPLPEAPVLSLLRDVDRIEAVLVRRHVPAGTTSTPVAWSEVGERVLAPGWAAERRSLLGELPPGFHLGVLPLDAGGLAELGEDVGRVLGRSLSRPEQEAYGHHVARAIIGEIAVAHGLPVEMVPGEPVWFGHAPDQFGLFTAYDDVIEGRSEPSQWYQTLDEAGLLPRPEAPAAAAAPASPAAPAIPAAPATPAVATSDPVPVPVEPSPPPASVPSLFDAPPPAAPLPRRRPTPATAPATAPAPTMRRPAGPASDGHRRDFDVPVGRGRRQQLLIDGPRVTWRGETIEADAVTHLAYTSGDVLEVRLWTGDGDVRIRMTANGRNHELSVPAWQALVRWTEAMVEGRLVDGHLTQLRERGRTALGDQVVTRAGVVVKGRVVPWSVVAGAEFDGRTVSLVQSTPDGTSELGRITADQPDVVLLPTLVAAAASAAAAGAFPGADAPG